MGKPTGFLEFPRVVATSRPPAERIGDWNEFHEHLAEATLQEQGARCMGCGVPFCHTGHLLDGLTTGCPLNNLIPEWNDLVYRGDWEAALARLHRTNNFPEFTGRVCPAPCEESCVLGINAPPVSIKTIERSIVDRGFEEGWIVPRPPTARTGRRVAVVGSGPAGLAAAAQLNSAGHSVTVLERADRIGGLLIYGIPPMKLEKRLVERRVALLAAEGVEFITGADVGRSYPTERLQAFDAVVLCGGATQARDLPVEGRQLKGVHFAMEFLAASTKSYLDSGFADGAFISARDRAVVVIGGGDTGTDCVGTALRHGCRSLVQLEIMPRLPAERAPENPWPQWARIHRVDYGQQEAEAVFGADPRAYTQATRRLIGGHQGQVTGVEVVGVRKATGPDGRPTFEEIPGTERTIPADLVLLAMGFLGPERGGLLDELDVALDARGNVAVDEHMMTSRPGVFAAGDMSRGQSLVVWAISEGRWAAHGVDRYLMGQSFLPARTAA
jgi:glutamate synthase (NADPH) small chain